MLEGCRLLLPHLAVFERGHLVVFAHQGTEILRIAQAGGACHFIQGHPAVCQQVAGVIQAHAADFLIRGVP